MIISQEVIGGLDHLTGENAYLKFTLVPAAGGKFTSIYNKVLEREFLFQTPGLALSLHPSGSDYDLHFTGGIDELIPNDIPETVDSVSYPDHGELWTTPLDVEIGQQELSVSGKLSLSGLYYKKTISLAPDAPEVFLDYTIRNDSGAERNFLWKLHAALAIEEGDRLITRARKARVADPDYSRFTGVKEFSWPVIETTDASRVPPYGKSMDFFYLYESAGSEMSMLSKNNTQEFRYQYDSRVFPYQWYFASYGGFKEHYTAILEPSTGMPIQVNEARALGQCIKLAPGELLKTRVRIYAGKHVNSLSHGR